jgi:Holliday junction resolvasome RuvABC endonuclease subunit
MQLGRLVTTLLALEALPEEDAADALAVAITHIQASRSLLLTRSR